MNPGNPTLSPQAAGWLRFAVFLVGMVLCIVVPFALWGEALDRAAPAWLGGADRAVLVALLGIALLIADVLLPIPSSVVGMALCWMLGPLWGGAAMALGLTLSFAAGDLLGRLVPRRRLRRWVGAPLWDQLGLRARNRALWWIAGARPLPVLAEMSALLAGVWRVPVLPAMATAALSSIAISALYAASVWLGREGPGPAATVLATFALPALGWATHRIVLRRLRTAAPRAPSNDSMF